MRQPKANLGGYPGGYPGQPPLLFPLGKDLENYKFWRRWGNYPLESWLN
jgi:hypothetical protein